MKKTLLFVVIIFILAVAGLFGSIFWWKGATSAPSTSTEEVEVLITRGSSAEKIGKELQEKGVIKSPFAFKLYIQQKGLTTKLPTGEFRLPTNLSLSELVEELLNGPEEFWVTIPEGLRKEEVAVKIASQLDLQDETLFLDQFLKESSNLEGYLFPDTYLFPNDVTAGQVVSRLVQTFEAKYDQLQVTNTTLTKGEIITLASIIERETLNTDERGIVAGILMNRLDADWPVQADATVQYAIANKKCGYSSVSCDWWPRPLTSDDLQIISEYNTYLNPGLPPSPIANPGLASLKAAANPTQTDYWFYIHADSQIYYAKTLEQHNANVRKYL